MGNVKISDKKFTYISNSSYPAMTAFTLHETKRAHAIYRVFINHVKL